VRLISTEDSLLGFQPRHPLLHSMHRVSLSADWIISEIITLVVTLQLVTKIHYGKVLMPVLLGLILNFHLLFPTYLPTASRPTNSSSFFLTTNFYFCIFNGSELSNSQCATDIIHDVLLCIAFFLYPYYSIHRIITLSIIPSVLLMLFCLVPFVAP